MDNSYDDKIEEQASHMETEEDFEQEVGESIKSWHQYAGFWMRFGAYIIDVILIASINGILLSPLLLVNGGFPIDIGLWTLNAIIATVIYYSYFILFTKLFQQTLGKMIVGIKVIHKDDTPLTWSDLFFREVVGRIIHNVFLILKLLYLAVAFSDEKQGFHDMIAETRVVKI